MNAVSRRPSALRNATLGEIAGEAVRRRSAQAASRGVDLAAGDCGGRERLAFPHRALRVLESFIADLLPFACPGSRMTVALVPAAPRLRFVAYYTAGPEGRRSNASFTLPIDAFEAAPPGKKERPVAGALR